MNLNEYLTAANILEVLVSQDSKASDLLNEALGYQRKANSFHDIENKEALQLNGYYRDTMRRCSKRLTALTGLDKAIVNRALLTIATDRL